MKAIAHNRILDKLSQFLYSSTTWIFVTALLIMSMILVTDTSNPLKLSVERYVVIVSVLGLLFSPVLIYSFFRKMLFDRLSGFPLYAIISIVFIVFPLGLWKSKVILFFFDPNWDDSFIPFVALVLLVTEILIHANKHVDFSFLSNKWIQKLSLETSILILLFPLAVIIGLALGKIEPQYSSYLSRTLTGFSHIFQTYIFLLVFYFFYFVNHYLLINRLFKEKGIVYYLFGFGAVLIIFYPISALIRSNLPFFAKYVYNSQKWLGILDPDNADVPLFVMLLSIPFILSYQWLKQNNEIVSLEKEKSDTELSLLKQQINPHFFFNTLNNLYALSLTKDERTPEVVLQLSDLMRYVIYEGQKNSTPISAEISYIEDYIKLQEIRLHKKLELRFEKDIQNDELQIAPLLFIILVENAFKHGIELAEGDCFLHIRIESSLEELTFSCTNSLEKSSLETKGIGLENLKRRLSLRYPDKHEFYIDDKENEYKAVLKIDLT